MSNFTNGIGTQSGSVRVTTTTTRIFSRHTMESLLFYNRKRSILGSSKFKNRDLFGSVLWIVMILVVFLSLQSFSVAADSLVSLFNCTVIVNNSQTNQTLSDMNCLNGGVCILGSGICNCTSGFTGLNCSIKVIKVENVTANVTIIPQQLNNVTIVTSSNETNIITNTTSLNETNVSSNSTNNSTTPNDNIPIPTWKCIQGVNCIYGNCSLDGRFCNCSADSFTVTNETLEDPLQMVYCSFKNCPNNCSMNGKCDFSTGKCMCSDPYFNTDCSLKNCSVSCVKGQGECDFNIGKCVCKEPYFGKDCSSIQCADPSCNSVGRCNHKKGLCECDADHFGAACEFSLCKNNCTQHGFCNTTSSLCSCIGAWGKTDCSINSNVEEMSKIKESSRIIGTLFVFLVPIFLVIGSYYVTYSYFGGYFFLIVEIFQFIGLTSLIGSNSPALYLKYSSFFEWSNFLFSTAESPIIQSAIVEISDITVRSFEEERLLLYKLIGISFIDNFVLITTSIAISIMISVSLILFKVIREKYSVYNNQDIDVMKDRIFIVSIRLSLLVYSGISLSTFYQIKMTLLSQAPIVTLFTALSILVAFVFGFPFLASVVLKANRDKICQSTSHKDAPFTPLHNEFKPTTYQFLLIILIKKCIFSFILGFFEGIELLIGLLCLQVTYLFIILIVRPFTQPGRNTIQIMVEAVNLFNIIVLVLFNALPFNSFASNLLSIFTIFLHCCMILLAVAICIFEKKRNTESNTNGYRAGLLTEEELEIQGTHTIFESDSEDDGVNNLDLKSDFHEIDLK